MLVTLVGALRFSARAVKKLSGSRGILPRPGRYVKEFAESFMMHLQAVPPESQPWGIRDFRLLDPTGALWRIGQSIE